MAVNSWQNAQSERKLEWIQTIITMISKLPPMKV